MADISERKTTTTKLNLSKKTVMSYSIIITVIIIAVNLYSAFL